MRSTFVLLLIIVGFFAIAQQNLVQPDKKCLSGNDELQKRQAIENSLTLLENKNNLIPLLRLDTLKIASISVGGESSSAFQNMLSKYTKVDHFNLPNSFDEKELADLRAEVKDYNLLIVGFFEPQNPTASNGLLFNFLSFEKKSIVLKFSNLNDFSGLDSSVKPDGLIIANGKCQLSQELAAQLVFGGIAAKGKLSENIGRYYKVGDGIVTEKTIRLKYTIPEEVGLDGGKLSNDIDSIVDFALDKRAFPGCNVLVAKDGKVIYSKVYGFHTYEEIVPVKDDDLYDLASVTKISGGLPGIMKLYDLGRIDADEKVSTYFPEWEKRLFHRSNKEDITVRELLAHQSGLVPFISFYRETLKDGKLTSKWYAFEEDERHSLYIAPGLWLDGKFTKYINKEIRKSPLKTRGKYVYSDLPFLIAPQIVTRLSGEPFQQFLDENFYRPLGATNLTYLPLNKFSRDHIIPTELDNIYRKQQLLGSVHDESAATMGGLSGNAGLFASANDLAKLMQMYLQMGSYGGKQYLSEATMKEFTRVQFPQNNNRRGMGFDKPLLNNKEANPAEAYPTQAASPKSFGHFGYTGTFVWMDPESNLLLIFLSNRVFPTRDNNLISDLNVRTDILKVVYENISRARK